MSLRMRIRFWMLHEQQNQRSQTKNDIHSKTPKIRKNRVSLKLNINVVFVDFVAICWSINKINVINVLFFFKEVFTMLDDYEEIKLIGFSEEAARLIQRKMNEQQPESVPELVDMIVDLGATIALTLSDEVVYIINLTLAAAERRCKNEEM